MKTIMGDLCQFMAAKSSLLFGNFLELSAHFQLRTVLVLNIFVVTN